MVSCSFISYFIKMIGKIFDENSQIKKICQMDGSKKKGMYHKEKELAINQFQKINFVFGK